MQCTARHRHTHTDTRRVVDLMPRMHVQAHDTSSSTHLTRARRQVTGRCSARLDTTHARTGTRRVVVDSPYARTKVGNRSVQCTRHCARAQTRRVVDLTPRMHVQARDASSSTHRTRARRQATGRLQCTTRHRARTHRHTTRRCRLTVRAHEGR